MSDFISKSAELADAVALSHKELAALAAKYANLGEVESDIRKQRESMRAELLRWVEKNGPQTIEGVGTLKLQERTTYSYDVKAIREQEPQRFAELLELDCIDINRTKAKPHERLSWLKGWEIPGGSTALVIIREDR